MYKLQLGLPADVTFGIEIEFEFASYDWTEFYLDEWNLQNHFDDNTRWHMYEEVTTVEKEHDIRYGGEIVSPILRDTAQTWKQIRDVCILLSNQDAKCGSHCGGHIHFGSQILGGNPKHWFQLVLLWAAYEDVIYQFSSGASDRIRKGIDEYARPIKDMILLRFRNFNSSKVGTLQDFLRYFSQERKTCGLDFSSVLSGEFSKDNTLEIRCPNGTIDYEIWQNNIRFFTHLLLYCKDKDFDFDFVQAVLYGKASQNASDLADLIYSDRGEKTAFMKQYRKDFRR